MRHRTILQPIGGAALVLLLVSGCGGVPAVPAAEDLPTGTPKVITTVPVGREPTEVAVGMGAVWVSNAGEGTVSRIDPTTNQTVATIPLGDPAGMVGTLKFPTELVTHEGAVWVTNDPYNMVARIDPERNEIAATIPLSATANALAAGPSGVWVASFYGNKVFRIDPQTNQLAATIDLERPAGVVVGEDAVWVVSRHHGVNYRNDLVRIDPRSNSIAATVPLEAKGGHPVCGPCPVHVAVGANGVWVTLDSAEGVLRIDPVTNRATMIAVAGATMDVVAERNAVWATSPSGNKVVRIDARSNELMATVPLTSPFGVAIGEGDLWVTSFDDGTVTRVSTRP